jgi:pyruvoyl-dependent arginine decarboxylase (PvlArgDC)
LSEEETKKKADKKETKKGKMPGEKEKALQEATQIAESVAKKKAEQMLEKKLEEGELSEEEEEEVTVTKITFEGKDYFRDEKNVVYDYNSQEEIGVWTGTRIDLYEP